MAKTHHATATTIGIAAAALTAGAAVYAINNASSRQKKQMKRTAIKAANMAGDMLGNTIDAVGKKILG